MSKVTQLFALSLMLLSLPVLSCAPGVSTDKYAALETQLGEANKELAQAKAELADSKTELDETNVALSKATDELTEAEVALSEANADLVEVQTACLEVLLSKRRSVREYANSPLTKDEVMKLLWAAQGITGTMGRRTAPSAGAFYPLRVYLAVGNVEDMAPGIYKYQPEGDKLRHVKDGDVRADLAVAAFDQRWVEESAVDIVIAAVYEKTIEKYGGKAIRYVHLEAGHAAQNILLEAVALNLRLVPVGGFDDASVADIVGMSRNENPLYIIPVGRKR